MAPKREIRKVALYCRVSTNGQDTAMQAEELRRMAEARGWAVAAVIEEKISGRKTRPARQELVTAAKAGQFDAIMVWSLSRWGRSTTDLLTSIRELDECGITFVSLKESLDLSSAAGRLLLTVLSAIAEFEAEQIKERVIAGMKHAKRYGTRTGRRIGRPATAAERAPRIATLVAQGVSLPEIAKRLEMPYSSVYRLARTAT